MKKLPSPGETKAQFQTGILLAEMRLVIFKIRTTVKYSLFQTQTRTKDLIK